MPRFMLGLLFVNFCLISVDTLPEASERDVVLQGIPVAAPFDYTSVSLARDNVIGAISSGSDTVLDQLIPIAGVDFLFERNERRYSPLSYAASLGKIGCMRLLRDRKAQLDFNLRVSHAPDACYTDLMLACERGEKESAELLLEHGSNVYFEGKDASTCLSYAARSGNINFLKFIFGKFMPEGSKESTRDEVKSIWIALY